MKKDVLFCLVALVFFLTAVGCGKKEDIVGTWSYGYGSSFVYVFNEDKTCSYAGKNCTYTIDGDKLSILYDGNTIPFETTYRIEDNKFIMKDSAGNDVEYTRQ